MAIDWDVQDLGSILGSNIKNNNEQTQDFIATEETGAIVLGIVHSISLASSAFVYQQNIGNHFTLDHPVNGELDSSILELDTGLGARTLFSSTTF